MRHRLPPPAGLSIWLTAASAVLLLLGGGLAAAAVHGCAPVVARCPTAWTGTLHPLLLGVRLATVSAVLLGAAVFGLAAAVALRRR